MIDTLALVIPLLTGPVQVDGRLQEPQYTQALRLTEFHPIEPGRGDQIPFTVYLWHDGTTLYAGFLCPEPFGLRAENLRRDRAHWNMDNFVSLTAVLPDRQNAYVFSVNPLGTVSDSRVYQRTRWNADWDFNWHAAVQRSDDTLWTVEMALPLAELGFRDTLYLQIMRSLTLPPDSGLFGALQLVPTGKSHVEDVSYSRLCLLEGGLRPARRLPFRVVLLPTLTLVHSATVDLSDRYQESPWTHLWYRTSLDYVSLEGDAWNLAATVQPDYAQVEADEAYLNLEQSALYLREKRPFFYEGFELFHTPLDALYTRALANPRWALKGQVQHGPYRAQAWMVEEWDLGLFGGLAMSRAWQSLQAQGFGLWHQGQALVDLYGRYTHPSGASFSAEGLAVSDSGWAVSLGGNYSQNMGFYFGGNLRAWSTGLSFPTLWTPYGNDMLSAGLWAGHNLSYNRPWFSLVYVGAHATRRWVLSTRTFFNENLGGYLNALVRSPLFVSLRVSRFRQGESLGYRFVSLGAQWGLQESRSVGVMLSLGDYQGQQAYRPGLRIAYQWQNLKASVGGEALFTRDEETGAVDTTAFIRAEAEYRAAWGLFARVFAQRTWNTPAFPRDEVQVILGYEPGGRSRMYFVVHPVRWQAGDPMESTLFFKVGYEFRY